MVVISRPYNGCDPGVNLGLPQKLRDLGVTAIPMDMLPLDEVDLVDQWQDMYWKYGQKIYSAAQMVRDDPRLHAIYITNFACGPDSFILHFVKEKLRNKPHLVIEVDEHSADVGAITRLEAFLDSLKNFKDGKAQEERRPKTVVLTKDAYRRKVYVPYMAEQAYSIGRVLRIGGEGVPVSCRRDPGARGSVQDDHDETRQDQASLRRAGERARRSRG